MNTAFREAVIAEWRGLPGGTTRSERWQTTAELLPKLIQKFGLRERLREKEIMQAWTALVGEFIAAHSCPISLRDGVLYVHVLQPALHYELDRISKPQVLKKLKLRFGGKTIRDLRFRLG